VTKKLCQYSSLRKVELVVKETSQTRRFLYVSACDGSEVLEAMFRYHHVPLHSCFQKTGSRITVMCNEVAVSRQGQPTVSAECRRQLILSSTQWKGSNTLLTKFLTNRGY